MRHYTAIWFSFLLIASIAIPSITNAISDDINICMFNAPEEEEQKPNNERFTNEQSSEIVVLPLFYNNSAKAKLIFLNQMKATNGFFDIATPPPKLA